MAAVNPWWRRVFLVLTASLSHLMLATVGFQLTVVTLLAVIVGLMLWEGRL